MTEAERALSDAAFTRVKFDVAWALAAITEAESINRSFPNKLSVDEAGERIIADCIDPSSWTQHGCKFHTRSFNGSHHRLHVGADLLTPYPGGRIILGGSGVNIQVFDEKLRRAFAFKVPRVSVFAYLAADDFNTLDSVNFAARFASEHTAFDNERQISRRLSHANIARAIYGGYKLVNGQNEGTVIKFPYSISEWIEGATPLGEYLLNHQHDIPEIIDILLAGFSALDHVHRQDVVHWDLKSDNLLVSKDGALKVIDFGNAKQIDRSDTLAKLATTTKGKYPHIGGFKASSSGFDESRRLSIELPDITWHDRYIDLWMYAQEWNRCLQLSSVRFVQGDAPIAPDDILTLSSRVRDAKNPRDRALLECLRIIFDRIIFPFITSYQSQFIGVEGQFDKEKLYYRDAKSICDDLRSMVHTFGAAQSVPELSASLDDMVRLPITGSSIFTPRISAIANTELARSTRLHYQLGQVKEIYPGATHTRFEHMIGTCTTAIVFLRALYLNEANTFWRVSATQLDVEAVILAAVLHDVGHLALGHFIEELDELMIGRKHEDFLLFVLQKCIECTKADERVVDAAELFHHPVFLVKRKAIVDLVNILKELWCNQKQETAEVAVDHLLERCIAIVGKTKDKTDAADFDYLYRAGTRESMYSILRAIVSGPIDADKLDYLRRDALHSGVFFAAGIDLERFLESLRACVPTGDTRHAWLPALGISEKGVAPLETVLTARYHLFSTVYWHRTVRCITAMLQRVFRQIRSSLKDEDWDDFLRRALSNFRTLDDRRAIEWLRSELESLKIIESPIGDRQRVEKNKASATLRTLITTAKNLMDALNGDRSEYFRLAFEFAYMAPLHLSQNRGLTWREELHSKICLDCHIKLSGRDPPSAKQRLQFNEHLTALRSKLESEFERRVQQYGFKDYHLDTILLDVPEPDKDQVRGLLVDRRSKRTLRGSMSHLLEPRIEDYPDVADFVSVSPIAAALDGVFAKWARKIRIFMRADELGKLSEFGFESADVSEIWLQVLCWHFKVTPGPQFRMDFSIAQ